MVLNITLDASGIWVELELQAFRCRERWRGFHIVIGDVMSNTASRESEHSRALSELKELGNRLDRGEITEREANRLVQAILLRQKSLDESAGKTQSRASIKRRLILVTLAALLVLFAVFGPYIFDELFRVLLG